MGENRRNSSGSRGRRPLTPARARFRNRPVKEVAHNHSYISREGWPWLTAGVVISLLVLRLAGPAWSLLPAVLTGWLLLLFRDPAREVPPLPLAVLAPVDGRVRAVDEITAGPGAGEWRRIRIAASHLGAYTIRAPIEGTVLEVRADTLPVPSGHGLWVRSEEQDDVVLVLPHTRLGLRPRTFVRYGERVGQGQRFAYLRLAPVAEVYVSARSRVRVRPGDRVSAGVSVLADLRHD